MYNMCVVIIIIKPYEIKLPTMIDILQDLCGVTFSLWKITKLFTDELEYMLIQENCYVPLQRITFFRTNKIIVEHQMQYDVTN